MNEPILQRGLASHASSGMTFTQPFRLDAIRSSVVAQLPGFSRIDVQTEVNALIEALDRQDPFFGYRYMGCDFLDRFGRLSASAGPSGQWALMQLLLLELISQFDRRFEQSLLPELFRQEFSRNFERMLTSMNAPPVGQMGIDLSNDIFLKDLGIVRLRLIPCVSHLVYRHSGIPRRVLLALRAPGSLIRFGRIVWRSGGFRPYLENHVHPAMLDRFDRSGRQQCYRLVAQLLACWPDAKGLIGTSWYYDPVVGKASPRLAYLHDDPLDAGAQFFDMGVHPDATAGALSRSATRASLAQQGRYQPRNYLMIWSRADILSAFGH